jgi:hypothetical protein
VFEYLFFSILLSPSLGAAVVDDNDDDDDDDDVGKSGFFCCWCDTPRVG